MAEKTNSTTTLYLIRHCEPEEQYLNQYYGQLDVPLGDKGLARSRSVAERLGDVPFDAVYSSDLQRAIYLAEQIATPRALPVRKLEVFRERHMGRLQGLTREQLENEHGDLYRQWLADRVNFRLPEAETFGDLAGRIIPGLKELAEAFRGHRVALVCHAGCIRVALAHALGMPLENIFRFGVNHGSIHVISSPAEGAPTVTLING